MKRKFFYALVDSFVGFNAGEFQHGFANTKNAVAFRCRQDRDDYLAYTRDLSAKAITRREASAWAYDCEHLFADSFVTFYKNDYLSVRGIEILGRYLDTRGWGEPKIRWLLADEARMEGLKAA